MWSRVDPVSHIQMFITLRQWGLKVVGMGKLDITGVIPRVCPPDSTYSLQAQQQQQEFLLFALTERLGEIVFIQEKVMPGKCARHLV